MKIRRTYEIHTAFQVMAVSANRKAQAGLFDQREHRPLFGLLKSLNRKDAIMANQTAQTAHQPILQHSNPSRRLDRGSKHQHTAFACFNQPPRFAVLHKTADLPPHAAFVSSASSTPIACLSNGRQGQGGFMPAGSFCRYCEPCPLSAAHAFAEPSGH